MTHSLRLFTLAGAFALALLAVPAFSAEKMEKGEKKEAPAGQEGTWVGQLGSSGGGADASLKAKDGKTLQLWGGDADVKKQIAELLHKKSGASVSGTLAPDGTNVKVSSISAEEGSKDKKRKGK